MTGFAPRPYRAGGGMTLGQDAPRGKRADIGGDRRELGLSADQVALIEVAAGPIYCE